MRDVPRSWDKCFPVREAPLGSQQTLPSSSHLLPHSDWGAVWGPVQSTPTPARTPLGNRAQGSRMQCRGAEAGGRAVLRRPFRPTTVVIMTEAAPAPEQPEFAPAQRDKAPK